jgi:hypothetical protein
MEIHTLYVGKHNVAEGFPGGSVGMIRLGNHG